MRNRKRMFNVKSFMEEDAIKLTAIHSLSLDNEKQSLLHKKGNPPNKPGDYLYLILTEYKHSVI